MNGIKRKKNISVLHMKFQQQKNKGQEHCKIKILGSENEVLTGLACLLNTAINEMEIDRRKIKFLFNMVLDKKTEITPNIRYHKIEVDSKEELEKVIKDIIGGKFNG